MKALLNGISICCLLVVLCAVVPAHGSLFTLDKSSLDFGSVELNTHSSGLYVDIWVDKPPELYGTSGHYISFEAVIDVADDAQSPVGTDRKSVV